MRNYDYAKNIWESCDSKIVLFEKSMFSLILENNDQENYFTEKIQDCLINCTIPIFWGCKNIGNFFNIKGFIIFENIDDVFNIINNLTPDDYYSRIEYIKENFNIANIMYQREINDINKNKENIFSNLLLDKFLGINNWNYLSE